MCFNVKTLFSPSKKSKCYFYPISTKRRFSNLISRFLILNFRWETYKKPKNIWETPPQMKKPRQNTFVRHHHDSKITIKEKVAFILIWLL